MSVRLVTVDFGEDLSGSDFGAGMGTVRGVGADEGVGASEGFEAVAGFVSAGLTGVGFSGADLGAGSDFGVGFGAGFSEVGFAAGFLVAGFFGVGFLEEDLEEVFAEGEPGTKPRILDIELLAMAKITLSNF